MDEQAVRRFLREPKTHQGLLTFNQVVARCGAELHVALVDDMPADRIVESAFYAEECRPLMLLAMNPATYRRAGLEAYKRWGVGLDGIPTARVQRFERIAGGILSIPVHLPLRVIESMEGGVPAHPTYFDWQTRL